MKTLDLKAMFDHLPGLSIAERPHLQMLVQAASAIPINSPLAGANPMQFIPIEKAGPTLSSELAGGSVAAQVVEAAISLYARRGYEMPWICYLAV